jgi:hypothetical protein
MLEDIEDISWHLEMSEGVLAFTIFGYENKNATNADDAAWLKCQVSTCIGEFSADLKLAFQINELRLCSQKIHDLLENGSLLDFESMEGNISLKVIPTLTGSYKMDVVLKSYNLPVTLSFHTVTERFFLKKAYRELSTCIETLVKIA